jgi:UDP-N-acetylglucosamine 2-epimerase
MNPYTLSKALDNKQNEIFLNLTTQKINEMNMKIINELFLPRDVALSLMKKIIGYRYVDEINDLKRGSYIRWINIKDPNKIHLTKGSTISDIKLTDSGTLISCTNIYGKSNFHIKMDECLIFQKLTEQEQVILSVVNYLDK